MLLFSKGKPSLSTQGTIIFTVISRNEYSPVCNVEQNISWSVRENSGTGTVIGTISCRDDDKDELNGQISVNPHWLLSQEKNDGQYQSTIPFTVTTEKSNTSQVMLAYNKDTDNTFNFLFVYY